MSAILSPLERLGLEVVAYTLIGSRWQAALLMTLIDAKGQPCTWETLAAARAWRCNAEAETSTRRSTRVRVCVLRRSLDDLGLSDVIQTAGQETCLDRAHGYVIPEPGRTRILERLIAEAA